MKELFEKYLAGLNIGDLNPIMDLFTEDAVVDSHLYGKGNAKDYFQNLINDSAYSKSTIMDVFSSVINPLVGAGHYRHRWTMKNGFQTVFDCVAIFTLSNSGTIRELSIIYDTVNSTSKLLIR